jgi:mercuric ion transport protein
MEDANTVPQRDRTARAGSGRGTRWPAVLGALAALGVCVSCCLLPLVLVGVGLSSAWVGSLDSFVPYKPIFVVAAAALLTYGFYAVYRRSEARCDAGSACKTCNSRRGAKTLLWVATVLAVSSILFDYFEAALMG